MAQKQSSGRKRSYRFELRLARNGSIYLTAKEFRVRNGEVKTNWIMLFEESLPSFVRAALRLDEMLNLGVASADDGSAIEIVDYRDGAASTEKAEKKAYSLDEIRVIYPRHGMAWDEAEETQLTEKFEEGVPIDDLAEMHERKETAIVSRLNKLGLIETMKEALER